MLFTGMFRGTVCVAVLAMFGLMTAPLLDAAQTAQEPAPVRVGGTVKPPVRLKNVAPVYPLVARRIRTQGVVILEVVIGKDGRVKSTKVIKSLPLLDDAAVDAVKQWVYGPPLVDDKPTPVILTIPVNFLLD